LIYNDVQLFWAKDENNDIAIIYDLDEEDRCKRYTCPICGSEVKPVAIGGMTKDGKVAQVTGHFSHFDASKCSSESAIHFWFKNKILVNGDNFIIKTDLDNEYKCKNVLIEQSYITEHGVYTPDITILTECGQTIYFEMNYTNKKKVEDYLDKWLELKNPVVEVDLKMLSNAMFSKTKYEFKPLFYKGKCFNTKKSDSYYNTVGQHKEKLYKNYTINEDIKNRLKKLDWFWLETINYKKGETDIEQLVDYIDYANKEDKELLFLILSKKRCMPIYEDYVNYKIELFEKLGNDFINNNCNGEYKDYFKLTKNKNGKKYKSVLYNTINIKNIYYSSNDLILCLIGLTKEDYLNKIEEYFIINKEFINIILSLTPYYNKYDDLLLYIKDKYKDCGMPIYIYKDNYANNHLYTISYSDYFSIDIYTDCIKNTAKSIELNILEDNNKSLIIDFICENINSGIEKYTLYLLEIEEKRKQQQEHLLLEIKQDKQQFRDVLLKVINIFDNNKDKIINYKMDFILDGKFNNLLYFKDYRGIEFIVHYRRDYIHKSDVIEKTWRNEFYKYNNYNFIEIDCLLDKDIYITETEDSYKICRYIVRNPIYQFPVYFNNSKINLSFRNIGNQTKSLLRYDFVQAIKKINDITRKIPELKSNYIDYFCKTSINKIYSVVTITNDDINKEIYKILYPIIYLANKYPNEVLNIKLNIDFATKDNKKRPWLIKEFIEVLNGMDIFNVHNII